MAGTGVKIGIIGMGRMGRCIVGGLIESGAFSPKDISFTTRHEDTAKKAEKDLSIKGTPDNVALVKWSDVVVFAVKPQNLGKVLKEIRPLDLKGKTLISIVASFGTSLMESKLPEGTAVVRAMPNTPAFVRAGVTALCSGAHAGKADMKRAESLFQPLGKVVSVDERYMDAVTGLSGCGPAYIYVVLESLTEGGIKVGLPRDLATQLAGQTVLGAAKMLLETGRHPSALKDEVTTPAGCTIDGLMELEDGRLRSTLIKAVVKGTERARALASQPPEE